KAEDTRCDIYAFGALLYECLTGCAPYQGQSVNAILKAIADGPPTPISTLNSDANPGLVAIAEKAMARELHDRYASMHDVIADLDRVAKGQRPLGTASSRRRRLLATVAVVLITGAIAALATH